jgi:AcrR family transcriptional regulator
MMALVALMHEKRYDAITVTDLLARAGVARSTFYARYRGKDDLLLTGFRRMLDHLDAMLERDGNPGGRIAPVRELFAHVGSVRRFERTLSRSSLADRQVQAGIEQVAGSLARRLASREPRNGLPVEPRAQALAGALFALLRWWLDHDTPYTPEQMDRLFHSI